MIRPTPLWRSVAVLGVAGLVLTAATPVLVAPAAGSMAYG